MTLHPHRPPSTRQRRNGRSLLWREACGSVKHQLPHSISTAQHSTASARTTTNPARTPTRPSAHFGHPSEPVSLAYYYCNLLVPAATSIALSIPPESRIVAQYGCSSRRYHLLLCNNCHFFQLLSPPKPSKPPERAARRSRPRSRKMTIPTWRACGANERTVHDVRALAARSADQGRTKLCTRYDSYE